MKNSQGLLSTILIIALCFLMLKDGDAQIQQNNITESTVVYTPPGYPDGTGSLTGILWLPSITNGAAVIMVHGLGGAPEDLHLWGDELSSLGYVALSIDYYAFENPFGVPNVYPGPVRAIKTAAEFLRKNAMQFGNYTGKVAVISGSGGSMHTAQTIIWDNDDSYFGTDPAINDHFDAAVLFYGWYDYYNYMESIFNADPVDNLENLVSTYFSPDPSLRSTKGNPFTNIDNITTPILMFHGTADEILQVEQSEEFRDSLVAHNKSVKLELVPGADHVYEFLNSHPLQHFNFNQWSDEGEVSRDTVIAWLARTLGVSNIHCPSNKSYWKNNSGAWNSDALPMKLGTTNYYTQAQLLSILNSSSGNDPSLKLSQDLIAAKLNLANNTYAPPIAATIIAADNLIGSRAIPIVPKISSNSSEGNQMISLANTLQSYNNGTLTPNCNNGHREEESNVKNNLSISVFPNSASEWSVVSCQLPEEGNVTLQIFDVQGKLIRTLANESMSEGTHTFVWNVCDEDGNRVSDGIYFLRMKMDDEVKTITVSVAK